ncbi:hypothetical protein SNE40_022238 [Patella caerulea]|uniref:Uncharacterized protein n=1 Tax=Patella caerulea TaxID=87958 RepID=A0AAN8FZY9_PATCE
MKVICMLSILLNCLALGLTASVQPDVSVDVRLEIATDVVSDSTSETDTASEPAPTTSEPGSTSEPTPTTDTVNDALSCNVTECSGQCRVLRCKGDMCNGIQCPDDQICVDGTCTDRANVCGRVLEDVYNQCSEIGETCGGEGQFCTLYENCVNGMCWIRDVCSDSDTDGQSCRDGAGVCSDVRCLVSCNDGCRGLPCVGGYCSFVKCGESYCHG